jgi:hypothetical protein
VTSLGVVVPVGLLAVCACVKVPPFQGGSDATVGDGGGDAPGDANGDTRPVTIETIGPDVLVTGPGYTMRFGSGGSRFPYQLDPGGASLMGGSPRCDDEDGMGIALYPVYRANGADFPGMGTPSLSIPLDGPYVGQIRLQWSGGFSCTSGTAALSGHSTFSFFPDGRLTRFDVVTNGVAKNAVDCTSCTGSGTGTTFVLTSYTVLIVDSGAFLSDGNEATLDTHGEEVMAPGTSACVRERMQSVAFSWVNSVNRLRVVNTAPRSIAFVKDIHRGATLPAESFFATTQMGVSATESCGGLETRIAQFSEDDHQLVINGNSIGAALADGIFGGDPQTDGYHVTFPVTISAAPTAQPRMPAGFAVWLYSNTVPANLTLTHSAGHTGTWYRMQRVGQNQVVLWFDVPLETGETITISES